MAELNVQPKKKGSVLPWLLLGLGVLALIIFLVRNKDNAAADRAGTDSANYNSTSSNAANGTGWTGINWNAPRADYDEVGNNDVQVRAADNYAIYGLGEDILFDSDKATIRSGAEKNLEQIVASIKKRYNDGEVRVFGFTDAKGSDAHNQQLSEQRAQAVQSWLAGHGIDQDHLSISAKGEDQPAASNETEEGRQQNRRVEIVARHK
jgi:outer membrane protein OmpA-like peptidoglycan-associated protein